MLKTNSQFFMANGFVALLGSMSLHVDFDTTKNTVVPAHALDRYLFINAISNFALIFALACLLAGIVTGFWPLLRPVMKKICRDARHHVLYYRSMLRNYVKLRYGLQRDSHRQNS